MTTTLYSLQYLCAKQLLETVHPLGRPYLLAVLINEQYGPHLQNTVILLKKTYEKMDDIIRNKRKRIEDILPETLMCDECEHEQPVDYDGESNGFVLDDEDGKKFQYLVQKKLKQAIQTLESCLVTTK